MNDSKTSEFKQKQRVPKAPTLYTNLRRLAERLMISALVLLPAFLDRRFFRQKCLHSMSKFSSATVYIALTRHQ